MLKFQVEDGPKFMDKALANVCGCSMRRCERALCSNPMVWARRKASITKTISRNLSTVANKTQYAETLNLPKTKFSHRVDQVALETKYSSRCTTELYAWQVCTGIFFFAPSR